MRPLPMTLPDPTDHEPIQGPRLRLRPITPDDLPVLLRWLSDPEVLAFYGRPPSTLAEARGEFLEPSSLPCWRFIIEADGRAIGENSVFLLVRRCHLVGRYRHLHR